MLRPLSKHRIPGLPNDDDDDMVIITDLHNFHTQENNKNPTFKTRPSTAMTYPAVVYSVSRVVNKPQRATHSHRAKQFSNASTHKVDRLPTLTINKPATVM